MFQKLYKHLEEITRNTQRQDPDNLLSDEWGGKICGQLAAINTAIQTQKKDVASRALFVGMVVLSSLGLVLVIILSWHCFWLSKATDVSLNRSSETSRQAGIVFRNYQELQRQHLNLETETARLGDLVQEQSQTIRELKKLNEMTTRAFLQLKKGMDQQHLRPVITGDPAH